MKKELFYLIAHDSHVDDSVFLFRGSLEEAQKEARIILEEMRDFRDFEVNEQEWDEGKVRYHAFMMDRDYYVTVGIPETI